MRTLIISISMIWGVVVGLIWLVTTLWPAFHG